MTAPLLEALKSDEFADSLGFILPPAALRQQLQATKEVQGLAAALAAGDVSETMVREFVSSLMADLRPNERFAHDLALAALAVALERRPTEFAEKFLQQLAALEVVEMLQSVRVARECLEHRPALAAGVQNGPASSPAR